MRAGLAVAEVVGGLATPAGEPLAARVGIATGLVVVGDLIGEGAAHPVRGFHVVGERPAGSRFEAQRSSRPAPMVGRDQELALVIERHVRPETYTAGVAAIVDAQQGSQGSPGMCA